MFGLFSEAEDLRRRGDRASLEEALRRYRETLPRWREVGELSQLAFVWLQIGNVQSKLGRFAEALVSFHQARQEYSKLGLGSWLAEAYNNIGMAHRQLGDLERASIFYGKAQDLWDEIDSPAVRATLLNNLGMVSAQLGRAYEALRYYDEALYIAREHRLRGTEAIVSSNLGNLYAFLGKNDEARDLLHRSAEAWKQAGGTRDSGFAITLGNLGLVHEAFGDLERARELQLRALSIFDARGDRIRAARTLGNLGRLAHLTPGASEAAAEAHRELLAAAREAGDRYSEAIALRNLGWLAIADDPMRAEELHRRAIDLFRASGRTADVADGFHHLAVALRRQSRLQEAEGSILESLELSELLRREIPSEDLRITYFATRQDRYAFAVDLLLERHREDPEGGHLARAFALSQAARARDLLDLLRDPLAAIRGRADSALLERERVTKARLEALANEPGACGGEDAEGGGIGTCQRRATRLLAELDRVDAEIRLDLGSRIGWLDPIAMDEIQRRFLDDETVLLQYDLSTETSFLWALTEDRLELFELPGSAVIDAQARQLRTLLARSHERLAVVPLARAREAAGRLLLGPVVHLLDRKKLMVVAEGSLESIPFSALLVPAATPSREPVPLLEGHEVMTLPSASVLASLRARGSPWRPSRARVAVVADPVFGADDPRLAGPASPAPAATGSGRPHQVQPAPRFRRLLASAREAREILGLVGRGRSFTALDFEASRETVTSKSFTGYDVYHFATHGWIDPLHPELSGVVLSRVDERGRERQGVLRVYEIPGLDLPSRLVVLSACSTALGRNLPGEGISGLARAFLLAGAQSVVVSLWKVNDLATAELMALFYRHLLQDEMPPASALRAARLELSRVPKWSAPFYWAAFVLQGDGVGAVPAGASHP